MPDRTGSHAESDVGQLRASFLGEIRILAETVSSARVEISGLPPAGAVDSNPIPGATDELDAVVEHTAVATGVILDACEQIDGLAAGLDAGDGVPLQHQTLRIYEACSFQDLTGQRIGRVVAALKMVEARIEALHLRLDATGARPDPLLAGPRSSDVAISQAEIDRLLCL